MALGVVPVVAAHGQRAPGAAAPANRAVYLDKEGVVRWRDDRREVALFGATPPDSVVLFIRPRAAPSYRGYTMRPAGAYVYAATVQAEGLREGPHDLVMTVFRADSGVTFPGGLRQAPTAWNYSDRASWTLDVVGTRTLLRLFDPAVDAGSSPSPASGTPGAAGFPTWGCPESRAGRSSMSRCRWTRAGRVRLTTPSRS